MPIPDLLTKLIANIKQLPYKKQEKLLRISESWLDSGQAGKMPYSTESGITKQDNDTDLEPPEITIFEERAFERKEIIVPIDFVGKGNLFKEMTQDISPGGLFIKTSKQDKFYMGQKVSMVFLLNDEKKPFKLLGEIMRIESKGIGVQFSNISAFECIAIEEELTGLAEENGIL